MLFFHGYPEAPPDFAPRQRLLNGICFAIRETDSRDPENEPGSLDTELREDRIHTLDHRITGCPPQADGLSQGGVSGFICIFSPTTLKIQVPLWSSSFRNSFGVFLSFQVFRGYSALSTPFGCSN